MAVASDGGTVLLNLTHLENGDALAAARKLLDGGHEVFVGVAVPARLRRELLQGIDDGAADSSSVVSVPRFDERRPVDEAAATSSAPAGEGFLLGGCSTFEV